MSNNREIRVPAEKVHIYAGIMRTSKGSNNKNCIRQVIKDEVLDLAILEAKLKVMGGEWRIYKTVNMRDVQKARIWLLHALIDRPEVAGYIDSEWRTALLQRECMAEKKFMLDIDTQVPEAIADIESVLKTHGVEVLERIKSPKGWHYITNGFDTREVIKLGNVTLLRDGYHYVKTVTDQKACNCCRCSGSHTGMQSCCEENK